MTLDMIHPELRRSAAILKVISPPFNLTTNRLVYVLSGIKRGKLGLSYLMNKFLLIEQMELN